MRAILLIGLLASFLFAEKIMSFPDRADDQAYQQARRECINMIVMLEGETEAEQLWMSEDQRYVSLLTLGFLTGICMVSKGVFGTTFYPLKYEAAKEYYLKSLEDLKRAGQ